MASDTKPCPECAEEIAVNAKKCRYCNTWLDKSAQPAARNAPPGAEKYAPCPKCELRCAEFMSWTWWGGVLGPRLFTHVKCANCKTEYNGSTGKSNTTNIVIYYVVIFGVVIGCAVLANLK